MKRIIKIFIALSIIAGIGIIGYTLLNESDVKAESTASNSNYSIINVTDGSLSKSVVSTGSLSMKNTLSVNVPVDITVDDVLVEVGDAVQVGDKLLALNTDALFDSVVLLEEELTTQNQTLADLSDDYEDYQTITSPVAGRVKAIYAIKGEYLQDSIEQSGSVVLLSTNGLMKASFDNINTLNALSEIKISSNGTIYSATLVRLKDGTATVTFSDRKIMPGDTVQLMFGDTVLGEASAEIYMPYAVTTDQDGLVSRVAASLNSKVAKNGTLLTLTNPLQTKDYTAAVKARQDAADKLAQANALLENPTLYAREDGIVASITATVGTAYTANTEVLNIYTGNDMEMAINVDELDIIHVQEGQTASLVMDALSATPYTATVSHISQLGTATSGITNYTVTLDLLKDEQLKLGMNGTATIAVGEETGLLVPLTAVQTDDGGSYVWLYQEGYTQTADEPGVKTYITTALSNSDYAVVTSGLTQGSQVLVVRNAVSATSSQQGGNMPGGMPGNMPSGMPMENFSMPSNFDRQRPSNPSGN